MVVLAGWRGGDGVFHAFAVIEIAADRDLLLAGKLLAVGDTGWNSGHAGEPPR